MSICPSTQDPVQRLACNCLDTIQNIQATLKRNNNTKLRYNNDIESFNRWKQAFSAWETRQNQYKTFLETQEHPALLCADLKKGYNSMTDASIKCAKELDPNWEAIDDGTAGLGCEKTGSCKPKGIESDCTEWYHHLSGHRAKPLCKRTATAVDRDLQTWINNNPMPLADPQNPDKIWYGLTKVPPPKYEESSLNLSCCTQRFSNIRAERVNIRATQECILNLEQELAPFTFSPAPPRPDFLEAEEPPEIDLDNLEFSYTRYDTQPQPPQTIITQVSKDYSITIILITLTILFCILFSMMFFKQKKR